MRPRGVLLLVLLLAPASSRAAGDEEWQAGVRLSYVTVNADGRTPSGALAGADIQYGITDAWAARVSLGISRHPVEKDAQGRPAGAVWAPSAVAGVTYTLDILRLVPTFELGVGLIDIRGDVREPRTDLGVEIGLGADWFLNKRWTIGGVTRYQFAPGALLTFPPDLGSTPFLFSIGARASRIF